MRFKNYEEAKNWIDFLNEFPHYAGVITKEGYHTDYKGSVHPVIYSQFTVFKEGDIEVIATKVLCRTCKKPLEKKMEVLDNKNRQGYVRNFMKDGVDIEIPAYKQSSLVLNLF